MTSILKLTDVVKSFQQPEGGSLTVLDIPSMEIEAGKQVALIGQSGGGKTTLLHLIAGLLLPDSGSIRINGTELTKLSEQGRDRLRAGALGYVFQTFNLLPAFTALENVRLGMTFGQSDPDPERAMDLLSRVGLSDRANYRPSQLSVGRSGRILRGQPRHRESNRGQTSKGRALIDRTLPTDRTDHEGKTLGRPLPSAARDRLPISAINRHRRENGGHRRRGNRAPCQSQNAASIRETGRAQRI
jgi:ABC-type uncharacterized transport system YnjBCD ATPase subunit